MWSAHMARHDPIHMVRHNPTYPQTKQVHMIHPRLKWGLNKETKVSQFFYSIIVSVLQSLDRVFVIDVATQSHDIEALGAERAGELRSGVVLPAIRLLQPKVSSSMNPFLYCEGEPLDPSSCEVSRLREIAGEMH
ncbi:hypothetical protein B296_00032706 [Ensete ventricosum]|uniref:Uncharacterized protein n=1 Tax=Ensete ventricosum TaxID=4639 RepID=A0A426ZBB5_ENSVE|nr:hypothetical protein B296_00032706 [Ensete ventricosum]